MLKGRSDRGSWKLKLREVFFSFLIIGETLKSTFITVSCFSFSCSSTFFQCYLNQLTDFHISLAANSCDEIRCKE